MPRFQIAQVASEHRDWPTKAGKEMRAYRVQLKDEQGTMLEAVEHSIPRNDPAPNVGEVLQGEVKPNGSWGLKFYKERQWSGGGGGGPRETHPRDAARMGMAHAQEQALKYTELKIGLGKIQDFTPEDVNRLAAIFAGAVDEAGRKAGQ